MPTLELSIDARGVESGARQAETAARRATDAMTATSAAATSAGQNINALFAATSSGLSVSRGIVSTAQALQQGSTAMAGFAASTALLDVSRLANDFASLRTSAGGSATVLGTLASVVRTHPILAIGSVIATAATAMSLFGDKTKDAVDTMRLARTEAERFSASLTGIGAARAGGGSTADAIQAIIQKIEADRRNADLTFRPARSDRGGFTTNLDNSGGPYAYLSDLNRQLPGITTDFARKYPDLISRGYLEGKLPPNQEVQGDYFISSRAFTDYLRTDRLPRERYKEYTASSEYNASPGLDVFASAGLERANERRREQIEESQRAMEKLVELGREFGSSVGDAFYNVAAGTQTARQAIAALISDIARATSRQAFSSLFGAVAGATVPQKVANVPPTGSNIQLP